MPYVSLLTSRPLDDAARSRLLPLLSQRVSALLGKPERWVMVTARGGEALLFGGSAEPAAYLELASLGLAESATKELSAALCELLSAELDVPAERIYIQFVSPKRALWGWNGDTFA